MTILQAQLAAEFFYPLAHAADTHTDTVGSAINDIRIDALPVIAHAHDQPAILLLQCDPTAARS